MLCTQCGIQLPENYEHGALCGHHASVESDRWAEANRVICDLIHRGVEPKRLSEQERNAEFFVISDSGAMA